MAEMDYRLIQKGDKPFWLSQAMEQVEVIEQLGDRYTIKLPDADETTKMRIPSRSLLLFEINALVTVEIKRNGQIVHCLAKIQDIIETGNPQAVVTLQDTLLDADNQPKQIDMSDLCGVQRINGQIVEHDMIPQGTKLEYRTDDDYDNVTIVKVNENEDPTLTTYDVKGCPYEPSDNQITPNVPAIWSDHLINWFVVTRKEKADDEQDPTLW